MADITKKEIEELLSAQTETMLDAVDGKLVKIDDRLMQIDDRLMQMENEMREVRTAIKELTITVDNLLKRITDYEGELTIMRAKLDKVTAFIKEKFGVEISAQ